MTAALPWLRRRHARALLGAVLLRIAYELLGHALVALPVLNATAASGIAQFFNPDANLFEDDGFLLLDLLRDQKTILLTSLLPAGGLLVLLSWGSFVPEWWLLEVLARRRGAAPAPATTALGRLAALIGCSWVLRKLLPTLVLLLAVWLLERIGLLAKPIGILTVLGLSALGVLLGYGLGLFRDLTAVAIVCGGRPLRSALGVAWARLRGQPLGILLRYAGCFLVSSRLLSVALLLFASGGTLAWVAQGVALLLDSALDTWWFAWLARAEPPRGALQAIPEQTGTAHADAFL